MVIDGKKIGAAIRAEIKEQIERCSGRKPGLAFILVGDNSASQTYVRAKKKACAEVGIDSTVAELPAQVSEADLLALIGRLNQNEAIDGILVQMPLPSHIHPNRITYAVDPAKDVDGFHPLNLGKLLLGEEGGFIPCTPLGIHALLQRSGLSVTGKRVIIAGRSNIVGKPLAALLMQKKTDCNATVTVVHSLSEHFEELTRSADVLIAAMGRPRWIKKGMVRPGSTVIDVGMNRLADGSLVGDVDFAEVSQIAAHITPVPGGVGPMTIAMLLHNTLLSYQKRQSC